MLGNKKGIAHFYRQKKWRMASILEDSMQGEGRTRCLCCGDLILYGRPDRKFCSSTCKNRWHNRQKYPAQELVERRIIRILRRNHDILDRLIRLNIRSLDRITLMDMGYHPDYVTSYRKVGIKHLFTCFDIHYEQTPTRIKKIVRTSLEEGADSKR